MSTENDSESRYGTTDEGFDDDRELFSRDIGRGTSKDDESESTEPEADADTETESEAAAEAETATDTEETEVVETPEPTSGQTTGSESTAAQSEQRTAGSTPTEEPTISESSPSPETSTETQTAQTAALELGVPGIDVSAVDPEANNEFPFIFERSGTQDAREHNWIYFQPHVEDAYTEAKRQAEDLYGDKMTETDVKEAIFIAGLQNFESAIDVLHEWGFREEESE